MMINLHTWFAQRQLEFRPKHFVRSGAEVSEEAYNWILERLSGRFYIENISSTSLYSYGRHIYFEDPKEATLFDLTWS